MSKKSIVCWEGLIMKKEHADLLELSTLRSALSGAVEETPDDKLGQRGAGKMLDKPEL